MQPTWRWFGPQDPVDLERVRQTGATGVVTSLSHVPVGQAWLRSDVRERQALIESAGLDWTVVESLPVHTSIRLREADHQRFVDNYIASLESLGACGVRTVCYNFMPVLDWTRTSLDKARGDGTRSLSFDQMQWAAFDLYLLERPDATREYPESVQQEAKKLLSGMSEQEREQLVSAAIGGLPGANEGGHTLSSLKRQLARWAGVGRDTLFENLVSFLEAVLPTCNEHGINLCIHPDDPPRPLLGLPRIMSSREDCCSLFTRVPDLHNGLTLCAGSFSADPQNKPHEIALEFASRIHFAHLRSVQVAVDGLSFDEADHLAGDVQLVELVRVLVLEERRRQQVGRSDRQIPMRSDHGAVLKGDLASLPGYPWLGRLKGLSELRGVVHAVQALV